MAEQRGGPRVEAAVPRVIPVTGFVGRLNPGTSPVERDEQAAIAACWADALAAKPKMFNGRILLAESFEFRDEVLHVSFREAAFATLVWLRTLPQGERPLSNAFGAAVVVSRDGAALLGRMAASTANAGGIYFPCGTPDLGDVVGERVDLEGSILRELQEETGLCVPLVTPTERRVVVMASGLVACLRRFDTTLDAEALGEAARRHIAGQPDPELDAFVLARSREDLADRLAGLCPRRAAGAARAL